MEQHPRFPPVTPFILRVPLFFFPKCSGLKGKPPNKKGHGVLLGNLAICTSSEHCFTSVGVQSSGFS